MTTPMMKQYQEIKAKVPDAILFFRLGDFYEMFGSDAELAAPVLEIALTSREAGEGKRTPMCGVPYHAVENYLSKLVSSGHKVAICEQMEDPKAVKGIVKREVIRIVSPGTVTEGAALTAKANNYLASVYHEKIWGLAFIDVLTGEFVIFETPDLNVLLTELERIHPSELILPNTPALQTKQWLGYYCTIRPAETFQNTALLEARFPKQNNLFREMPAACKAASSLWHYLEETSPGIDPIHILNISTYSPNYWMILDQWTRRNLELTESMRSKDKKGTLLSVLDLTRSAFGGRLLKHWVEQPLLQVGEINRRLDAIDNLICDGFLRQDLRKMLTGVYDLERLMGKVSYANINAKDLLALSHTLNVLPQIVTALQISKADSLKPYIKRLQGLEELGKELEKAVNPDAPVSLKEGNLIRSHYAAEIDELRIVASQGKSWLAKLESTERERTGIRSLKIGYNKVFGYYIEVTHANARLVPDNYQRKQTLANAERFITPELKEFEDKILGAEERLIEMEYELFLKLRRLVQDHTERILAAAHALAEIDVFLSLAEVAVRYNYVRPVVHEGAQLHIVEGRHPVVEQMLDLGTFVPNDVHMTDDNYLAMITGPNMAGKSTYMRQTALIVLMAHIGSFVPAQKAEIPLSDHIFTRVGASDDLAAGQSTFMVEMQEVAHILRNVTDKSLVILDEVGRGTATFDGLSIAWAIAEHLVQDPHKRGKILFATHYHELTQLEDKFPGIFNLHVGVKERGEEVIFLHKILPGRSDRSYGIQVARLAGLPGELLMRAKVLLKELESSYDHLAEQPQAVSQLSLFEEIRLHPLLKEIEELPLDDMTAKQALNYLFELQDRIKGLEHS